MAGRGAVRLSIYSTFDDKGTKRAERAMKAFTKAYGEANDETGKLELDERTRSLAEHSIALDRASEKLSRFSGKAQAVGGALTKGVTLPLAGAGAAAVKAAVDIDTALTGVRKTVDGTEEQYRALKKAAIDYSKVNAVSAEDVLDAQALGAQLGFAIDELDKFSQVATGLDIATDMDLEDGAKEMAQFANITKMGHDEIDRYGSTIVNLGNNMATTESAVSSMGQRTAAAGKQIGMSVPEILGWSGAMTSMGINAEAGGTAFSTTVATIDRQVAAGGKNLEAYAKYAGMSADEFKTSWKRSASETFLALLEGVGAADNLSVALGELGVNNIRQTDMMKRLAGNTGLVSQALGVANAGWQENSALSNEVANRNDSLAAKMQMLKNRAVAIGEQVGGPLADALLDAADAAEPLFDGVSKAAEGFAALDKDAQRTALRLVATAAAAGPTITATGKVAGGLSSVAKLGARSSAALAKWSAQAGGLSGKLAGAASGLAGVKGGLAGIAVAGALAVGVMAKMQYDEQRQKAENLQKSTEGLASVQDAAASSASGLSGALGSYGASAAEVRGKTDELMAASAAMTDRLRDTYAEYGRNSAELGLYTSRISELTSKSSLSRSEQTELAAAVKRYNEITGSSVEVTDAASGKLSASTDEIKENAKAWQDNALKQAYAKQISEATSDMVAKQTELTQAQIALADANAQMEVLAQEGVYTMQDAIAAGMADSFAVAQSNVANAKTSVDDLTRSIDADRKAIDEAKDASSAANQELLRTAQSVPGMARAMRDSGVQGGKLSNALDKVGVASKQLSKASSDDAGAIVAAYKRISSGSGMSFGKIRKQMKALGVSGSDLKKLTASDWAEILSTYDGKASSIAGVLDKLVSGNEAQGRKGGKNFLKGYTSGMKGGGVEAAAKKGTTDAAKRGSSGSRAAGKGTGEDYGQGYAAGIESKGAAVSAAAAALGARAKKATAAAQKSKSPSKVARRLGSYYGQGYALGIADEAKTAQAAAAALVPTAFNPARSRARTARRPDAAAQAAASAAPPARQADGTRQAGGNTYVIEKLVVPAESELAGYMGKTFEGARRLKRMHE